MAVIQPSLPDSMPLLNNGRAFVAARPPSSGMGLNVMRYRAGMIGASLSFEPGKRNGVRVTCTLPGKK